MNTQFAPVPNPPNSGVWKIFLIVGVVVVGVMGLSVAFFLAMLLHVSQLARAHARRTPPTEHSLFTNDELNEMEREFPRAEIVGRAPDRSVAPYQTHAYIGMVKDYPTNHESDELIPVRCIAFSHDKARFAFGGDQGHCDVHLAFEEYVSIERVFHHGGPITGIALRRDLTAITCGPRNALRAGSVCLWNWQTSKIKGTLPDTAHDATFLALADDDNHLLIGTGEGNARLYAFDREQWTEIAKPEDAAFSTGTFAPNATRVMFAAGNRAVSYHDGERREFPGETDSAIRDLRFAHDGETFFTAHADGIARCSRAETGEIVARFDAEHGALTSIDVDDRGEQLITADESGEIRCWNCQSGKVEKIYRGHQGAVTCLRFLPYGHCFLSAGIDGTMRRWRVKPEP